MPSSWTLPLSLLLASAALVALILIPSYKSSTDNEPSAPVSIGEDNHTTSAELNVDIITAYRGCSDNGAPWHICTMPESYGGVVYCPAYSEFNESEVLLNQWVRNTSGIGVFNPLEHCFPCPGPDSDCYAVVNETMAANNISRYQMAPGNPFPLYDLAVFHCLMMCESPEVGSDEPCGIPLYTPCKVSYQIWTTYFSSLLYHVVHKQFLAFKMGESFCDVETVYDIDGTCKPCPADISECYKVSMICLC